MPQPSSTPAYPGTGRQAHDPLPPAELGPQEARRQIAELHRIGRKYHLIPGPDGLEMDELAGLQLRPGARVAKRTLDIVLGSILALLAVPLVLVSAMAISVSLRTKPFFVQRRIGQLGHEFTILKIRTLPTSVPSYGNKHELGVETMKLPFLARLLRNAHLDELPQLFLVPIGKMSLVGPRPCQPVSIEPVPSHVELMRTAVPQGCTGVWQISRDGGGLASASPELDEFYLHNASVRLDLWILVRTVGYVLGLAKPITTADVPRWVVGRGLVSGNARLTGVPVGTTEISLAGPQPGRRPQAAAETAD
jgi:lipopolysaccharide/colanic/teichoic acid biosynthesis glycosyltransferase